MSKKILCPFCINSNDCYICDDSGWADIDKIKSEYLRLKKIEDSIPKVPKRCCGGRCHGQ